VPGSLVSLCRTASAVAIPFIGHSKSPRVGLTLVKCGMIMLVFLVAALQSPG
jgi:hypothetical protein